MLNKSISLKVRPTSFTKQGFPAKPEGDIVDIYSRLTGGKLKKTGKNYTVSCCFHKEDTPSLVLYPSTSSYFCFGCQKHGDIFDLVEGVLGCSFTEALQYVKSHV